MQFLYSGGLREGGIYSILGSVITGLVGRPYWGLKVSCCFISIFEEHDDPRRPNDNHNITTMARDIWYYVVQLRIPSYALYLLRASNGDSRMLSKLDIHFLLGLIHPYD